MELGDDLSSLDSATRGDSLQNLKHKISSHGLDGEVNAVDCMEVAEGLSAETSKLYFGTNVSGETKAKTAQLQKVLLLATKQLYLRKKSASSRNISSGSTGSLQRTVAVDVTARSARAEGEKLVANRHIVSRAAYRVHQDKFPPEIWNCCSSLCFSNLATNPGSLVILHEFVEIHNQANNLHKQIDEATLYVQTRRRGIGGSHIAWVAESRDQRNSAAGESGETDRQKALSRLASFAVEVLPFLYGHKKSPSGVQLSRGKICTNSICCLLGVSRNFLFRRKSKTTSDVATAAEITSLADNAGVRIRQLRRIGRRDGYTPLEQLSNYQCGCDEPCLSGIPEARLRYEFAAFSKLAQELLPRHKENRFLLNLMFCPLSNTTVRQCNRALSQLFTVSERVIADVRSTLDAMCADPSIQDRPLLSMGENRYYKHMSHPMNRFTDAVRERIENHLNMVLRADPAGSGTGSAINVCRVYDPEINTHEKLRHLLLRLLDSDEAEKVKISRNTLTRMIDEYMRKRNLRVVYKQTDHNACPNCKSLQYAVLQFHYEAKEIKAALDKAMSQHLLQREDDSTSSMNQEIQDLQARLESKLFQEEEAVKEFRTHNDRDRQIRQFLKIVGDYFRGVENNYFRPHSEHAVSESSGFSFRGWNELKDHAIITHQDDMTKVDLPYFVETASADITRWHFDLNAHVSSVNNVTVVFSHDQGTGPKKAGTIMEEILLDHIVRCRGEAIKFIVSDNASVGKNWLTTIALPQYLIDQDLADVAVVVFLENNHGKWLCDMLFGQLQTKRRRTTLLSVDDLLAQCEAINRRDGRIWGFAVNPLSTIDFAEVLTALGYQTIPPKGFNFTKRNIHFAAACNPARKRSLPQRLHGLLGPLLPDEPGMVRISTDPPCNSLQRERFYENRYLDVPAAIEAYGGVRQPLPASTAATQLISTAPLVVSVDQKYEPSGSGVVSTRTANHVGYNGYEFRKKGRAFPELQGYSTALVKKAWPEKMLRDPYGSGSNPENASDGIASLRCAPENWVIRRPLSHFGDDCRRWKARYPPRNLLNAKFKRGPRNEEDWIPTQTYYECPFPIIEGTSACRAMKKLESRHSNIACTVNTLDVLKAIYEDMGNREIHSTDQWLQRRVTTPSAEATQKFTRELKLFIERERGHPRAPNSVK